MKNQGTFGIFVRFKDRYFQNLAEGKEARRFMASKPKGYLLT